MAKGKTQGGRALKGTPTTSLDKLQEIIDQIRAIDRNRLYRPSLGKSSLESELSVILETLDAQLETILEFWSAVGDSTQPNTLAVLLLIKNEMENQSKLGDGQFVSERENHLNRIAGILAKLKDYWPAFITAAMEARGFLEIEDIKKHNQGTIALLKKQTDNFRKEIQQSIASVKEETSKAVEEAKKRAQEIENKARQTAEKISVKDAQEQFEEAGEEYKKHVRNWSLLASVAILAFLVTAIIFYQEQPTVGWQAAYYTAIRITILTGIGAAATFCLRVLRAHMHIREHNLHRKRLANSLVAFVESASTEDQRDLILAHLVDAITTFGSTGLLRKEDDSVHISKSIFDSMSKSFAASTKKS